MKEEIFINFTNHPSCNWEQEQLQAARVYGRIVNLPFPEVDAEGDEEYIVKLAEEYVAKILQYRPEAVLCQGEFCLAYQVINRLKAQDIMVLAACSQRCVQECGNRKEVYFNFTRFRRY